MQVFAGTTTALGGGAEALQSPIYNPPAHFAFSTFPGHGGTYVDIASIACAGFKPKIDKQTSSAIQVSITCTTAPNAGMFSLGTEGNMVLTGGHGKGGTPQHFFWQAKATPSTLRILYTGEYNGKEVTNQDVTNKKVHVHAGWPIKLTAQLTPANAKATYTWTIAGSTANPPTAIKNFQVAADDSTGRVIPLADTDLATKDPPTFYFVDNTKHVVSCSVAVAGQNHQAKTTFDVTKPQTGLAIETPTGVNIGQFKPGYGVGFGQPVTVVPNNSGIYFELGGDLPGVFKGKLVWAQIYKPNRTETLPDGTVGYMDRGGLDAMFPYPNQNSDRNAIAEDLPAQAVAGTIHMSVKDHARMWLLYYPKVTSSIWIPVASQAWWWKAVVAPKSQGRKQWVFVGNPTHYSAPANPPANETNTYPTWTRKASHKWHSKR